MSRSLTLLLVLLVTLIVVQPAAGQFEKEAGKLLFHNALYPAPAGPGKVAFLRVDPKIPDSPLELYVGDMKTLAETRVLPGINFSDLPAPVFAWSPDGTEFLVPQKVKGNWEIFKFKTGEKTGQQVGSLIQFRENISPEAMKTQQLTDDMILAIGEMAYSPSGKFVIFTLNRPGKTAVFWMDLQTGKVRQATESQIGYNGSFAPDDDHFSYCAIVRKQGMNTDEDIILRSIKTGATDTLLHTTAMESEGSISPDGKFLVYRVTGSKGENNLWIMNLATKESRQFTTITVGKNCVMPHWTSDGRQIVYQGSGFAPQPGVLVKDFVPF